MNEPSEKLTIIGREFYAPIAEVVRFLISDAPDLDLSSIKVLEAFSRSTLEYCYLLVDAAAPGEDMLTATDRRRINASRLINKQSHAQGRSQNLND